MTLTCVSLKVEPNYTLPKARSSARARNAEGAASEGYRIAMPLRQLADPRPRSEKLWKARLAGRLAWAGWPIGEMLWP